jgi:hypothetical protein
MTAQPTPLENLFEELTLILGELKREFMGRAKLKANAPTRKLKPFSSIIAAYEGSLQDGLAMAPRDLGLALYQLDVKINPLVSGRNREEPQLGFYDLGALIGLYYELPEDQRDRALQRSDELMDARPMARSVDHELIWRSELPVGYIHSRVFRRPIVDISAYEHEAYAKGHDTALWKVYGYYVLMLLTPEELEQALKLLRAVDPSADPKTLSVLAQFKRAEMTPTAFLGLLALGYTTPAHVRAAAKAIGITSWTFRYFDRILQAGPQKLAVL